MSKASRALRRSGVRIKSMNSGHTDLALAISGIGDIGAGMRSFQNAHALMTQDLLLWSRNNENRAIQDVMERINELNFLWADSLSGFYETLEAFRVHYEMILDGEKVVDTARASLGRAEQKERKIKRYLKKISKKASADKMMSLEMELSDAERAKDLAQFEAVRKAQENEICKIIRVKEGLTKLSESYVDMAQKMAIIFDAQREVVQAIPDVNETAIHRLKYTGSALTEQVVQKARNRLDEYQMLKFRLVPQEIVELPPPYTPGFYDPVTGAPYELDSVSEGAQLRRRTTSRRRAVSGSATIDSSSVDS